MTFQKEYLNLCLKDPKFWLENEKLLYLYVFLKNEESLSSHYCYCNNESVFVEKNQLVTTTNTLAKKMGVSKSTIHRLFKILEEKNLIKRDSKKKYTIITMLKDKETIDIPTSCTDSGTRSERKEKNAEKNTANAFEYVDILKTL